MLSVYKLQTALHEAATGSVVSDVPSYHFIGGLDEAVNEFQYQMMLEAIDYEEFTVSSDEIMTEAAMSNPDVVESLSENVFTSLIDKAQKFFNSVISMVKGLIEKIKAYIAAFTGKYSKWVGIMKPKISAAKNPNLVVSVHKWNETYITKELPASISEFVKVSLDGAPINKADVKASLDAMVASAGDVKSADSKSDANVAKVKLLNDAMEDDKTAFESFVDDFPTVVAKAVGVSESASIGAVYSAVVQKATGGEKANLKFGSDLNANQMIETINSATNALKVIKDAYDADLKSLSKVQTNLNDIKSKIKSTKFDNISGGDDAGKAAPSNVVNAVRSSFTMNINNSITMCRMGQDVMSKIHNIDKTQLTSMVSEYMGALSKYAGGKEEKETK